MAAQRESSDKATCYAGLAFMPGKSKFITFRCKRWDCPACGQVNAMKWGKVVVNGIEALIHQGDRIAFWTMTMHPKLSRRACWQLLPVCWDAFRKALQRDTGGFTYANFVELHPKSRKPHMHLITTNTRVTARALKARAARAGFGHQAMRSLVTERYADDAGVMRTRNPKAVGWYVAKYVAKGQDAVKSGMPTGFRRVRLSTQWPRLAAQKGNEELLVKWPHEPVSMFIQRVKWTYALPDALMWDMMEEVIDHIPVDALDWDAGIP